MNLSRTIGWALLASPCCWGQVSLLEPTPSGEWDVVVLDRGDFRPPDLQGIQPLPIDFVGRTLLLALQTDSPRLRMDIPGASRIQLPRERGSLYKFVRDDPAGGHATFGFFVVGPNGLARSLLQRPGTGPAGDQDPFVAKLALAASGAEMLVATTSAAGGDLLEVDLLTGATANRTDDQGPLDFRLNGLVLLPGWGIGLAQQGLYRFSRTPAGKAARVSVSGSLPWLGNDVVASADGSTVAFEGGSSATQGFVYACRQTGSAWQVSATGGVLTGAGFLPEDQGGPTLALSTDGSRVAWRVEGTPYRECYLSSTVPSSPDVHVTRDEFFDDTLNDTGVIAFFSPDALVLMAGRGAGTGINRGDLFRVDVGPGSTLTVANLSGTSGILQPPYDYGTLEADEIYQLPESPRWLALDYAGTGRLLWIEQTQGSRILLDRVTELDLIEVVGDHVVTCLERPPGVDDPLNKSLNLYQVPLSGAAATVTVIPPGCRLSRPVASRSSNRFGAVLEQAGLEYVGRLTVPSSRGFGMSSQPVIYGPTLVRTPDGAFAGTVNFASSRLLFSWSDLGVALLRSTAGQALVLPGA